MGIHQITPPVESPSPSDPNVRKRVCKACDRCRLKKSKCDGSNPCSRCKADNAICVFGERKKSHDKVYPKGYVEMLESQQAQLVVGLQELYKRTLNGQGWTGAPLKESSHGAPLTHDILEHLGALKQDGQVTSESFEEDLQAMQQSLIANGASLMQREASSDTSSENDHSPSFEQFPTRSSIFTDPFAANRFPPTPPNHSPFPQSARTVAPLKTQSFSQYPNMPVMNWMSGMNGFDDNMDFINKFESPLNMNGLAPPMFHTQVSPDGLNPCLPMKDWVDEEDDYQRFLNPVL